ncbi:Nuclear import protein MOG1 [Lachancea thermotolerans]
MFQKQVLYGGAISTVIPKGFLDASILREVPDTQEVFVNSREEKEIAVFKDGLGLDESVIVDLLQRVEEDDNCRALDVHLQEIAGLNGSHEWNLVECEQSAPEVGQVPHLTCIAVEAAYKWGKSDMRETLVLCVALLRFDDVQTDVVLSVNIPVTSEPELQLLNAWLSKTSSTIPPRIAAAYHLVKQMASEFRILDKGLFV